MFSRSFLGEKRKISYRVTFLDNIFEIREGISPLIFTFWEFGFQGSGYTDVILIIDDSTSAYHIARSIVSTQNQSSLRL
jgi:hypothetical protein